MSENVEFIARMRDQLSGPLKNITTNMNKFGAGMKKVGIAAGMMAGALLASMKTLSDYGSAMYDAQQATGISAQTLQGMGYLFEQAGGSANSMATSLRGLTPFLIDVAANGTRSQEVLERLGLTQEQIGSMSMEDAYLTLAESLRSVTDEQERFTTAAEVFGNRYGQQVLAMLESTPGPLREMVDGFVESGRALSGDQIEALDRMGDAFTDLQYAMRSMTADALVPMIPALINVFDIFNEAAGNIFPAISPLLLTVTEALGRILATFGRPEWSEFVGTMVELAMTLMDDLEPVLRATLEGLQPLLPTIIELTTAVLSVASPLLALAAQILPAVIDAVAILAESAIGTLLIPALNNLADLLGVVVEGWTNLIEVGTGYRDEVEMMAEANRTLATMLARQVQAGMMTAEEATEQLSSAIRESTESVGWASTAVEANGQIMSDWRTGVYAAAAAERAAAQAGAEFNAWLATLPGQISETMPGLASLANRIGTIFGMIEEVETPETVGNLPRTYWRGMGELSPEEAKNERIKEQIRDLRAANEDRLQAEADRIAALREKEERRYAAEQEHLNQIRTLRDRIQAKEQAADREREAALTRARAQAVSFGMDLFTAAQQGTVGVEQWADNFIAQMVRIVAQKAFQLIIDLLSGGIGGKMGGLFGFFSRGGEVRGAQSGAVVPDSGPFGDRHPYLLERGEVVVPRDIAKTIGSMGKAKGDVHVHQHSTFSSASQAELAIFSRAIRDILRRDGLV